MTTQDQFTSTVEDYLKTIFVLSQEAETAGADMVQSGRIADKLSVTAGTVTTMMRHLGERNLVTYRPRKGVTLTDEGREEALRVIRRHRMTELFLVNIMKVDWAHVHEEAEALEHSVSERLLDRMDQMLGHPTHDPHGDPIPDAQGDIPDEASHPLSGCEPGTYRIVRIINDEASFLNWLESQGLQPGCKLELKGVDSLAETLSLKASTRTLIIGLTAGHHILVAPV